MRLGVADLQWLAGMKDIVGPNVQRECRCAGVAGVVTVAGVAGVVELEEPRQESEKTATVPLIAVKCRPPSPVSFN